MSAAETDLIGEHETVVLLNAMPEHGLQVGDIGVVIDIGRNVSGQADEYLLEIFAANGATLGLVSVGLRDVRRARSDDAPTVRPVAAE